MWSNDFFGDLSPFQIFVAVVAFLTGGYTFYKSFLQRAKLALYTGDAVRLVILPNGSVSAFNLLCNIVNTSMKTATLHRLEAEVLAPTRERHKFAWYEFYEYKGGYAVGKKSDPYPIAVTKEDSEPLFVQFRVEPSGSKPAWPEGKYEFTVVGWVNRKNKKKSSNLKTQFHIRISPEVEQQLGPLQPQQKPFEVAIPILEWS